MAIQILDGKGSGSVARVANNKLDVRSVSSTPEHHANHSSGLAFNVTFSNTTPTSGDCFFYLQNNDNEKDISLEGILIHCEMDNYIDMKLNNTGTPANGNPVTPINLNTRSGNIANCTCQFGTNITGLTDGDHIIRYYLSNSAESIYYNFDHDIILGPNGVFTIWMGEISAEVSLTINFSFYTEED